jgi:hypothetical protein
MNEAELRTEFGFKGFVIQAIQAATGCILGLYVWLLVATFYSTNGYKFVFVFVLLYIVPAGAVLGPAIGGVIWLLAWRFRSDLPLLVRIAVAVAVGIVAFSALSLSFGQFSEEVFVSLVGPSLAVGIPIGMLVGSGLEPLRIIAFGLIGRHTSQGDKRAKLAIPSRLIAGTPLRLFSLFGLSISLFVLIYNLSRDTYYDVPLSTLFTAYFLASVFISFSCQRTWIVRSGGLLLTLPLLFLIQKYLRSGVDDAKVTITASVLFLLLWIPFLIGYRIPTRRASLQPMVWDSGDNLGCLGSHFRSWERGLSQ